MIRHAHKSILGPIPDEWDDRPIRTLLADSLSGDWGDDAGEVMLSVLRSTNFDDSGNLDLSDVAKRGFSAGAAKQIQVQPGDILLERSGGGPDRPVGRVVNIPDEMPATGFANFIQCLRPDRAEVDPEFLCWALFQLHHCGQVARIQHQTTQMRNLDLRDYHRVRLPYPKPAEQAQIAAVLTAADDHARALYEQLCRAERVCIALDQHHFGGEAFHARFPYECGTGRTIPTAWGSDKLGSLAAISSGITLNQDREAASNGVRYLTVVNVYRGRIDLTEVRRLELRGEEATTKILREGDILVVEGHANPAEIGRAARVSEREAGMSFQNHLFRVRVNDENQMRPRFLVRALNSERVRRNWVAVSKTSSGLSTINRTTLRRLVVPFPKPEVQDVIVAEIEASEQLVSALTDQLRAARRVKQSLLQNLLTGRIRLKP